MLAEELIMDEIPPLKPTDKGEKALKWMDEFKVSHLPVVDKGKFLGLITEPELMDLNTPQAPIREHSGQFLNKFVFAHEHVFEIVKAISDQNLTVIPVLSEKQEYLGCISLSQLMKVIAEMPVVEAPGGIIILEVNVNDYMLSQIAQIVETNDAKIMGCFITSHPDSTKMEVTLKINRTDLGAILQTFNRYDYVVTGSYDQSSNPEDLKGRYDLLMNYLNM